MGRASLAQRRKQSVTTLADQSGEGGSDSQNQEPSNEHQLHWSFPSIRWSFWLPNLAALCFTLLFAVYYWSWCKDYLEDYMRKQCGSDHFQLDAARVRLMWDAALGEGAEREAVCGPQP